MPRSVPDVIARALRQLCRTPRPARGASLPPTREWHPQTEEWWADLWAAPMSNEYHASDRHALYMLAALMDDFWTTDTAGRRKALSEEIRLSRQAFGLTPYDRRRLEWTDRDGGRGAGPWASAAGAYGRPAAVGGE
jgi:hypothetical protein